MPEETKLHILWTNADLLTADKMVMMYAMNAKKYGWWEEVTVIIWGATAKLAAENPAIKDRIAMLQSVGVEFSACIACAEQLGVADELRSMGIEVKGWGQELTRLIKEKKPLITV